MRHRDRLDSACLAAGAGVECVSIFGFAKPQLKSYFAPEFKACIKSRKIKKGLYKLVSLKDKPDFPYFLYLCCTGRTISSKLDVSLNGTS